MQDSYAAGGATNLTIDSGDQAKSVDSGFATTASQGHQQHHHHHNTALTGNGLLELMDSTAAAAPSIVMVDNNNVNNMRRAAGEELEGSSSGGGGAGVVIIDCHNQLAKYHEYNAASASAVNVQQQRRDHPRVNPEKHHTGGTFYMSDSNEEGSRDGNSADDDVDLRRNRIYGEAPKITLNLIELFNFGNRNDVPIG